MKHISARTSLERIFVDHPQSTVIDQKPFREKNAFSRNEFLLSAVISSYPV